MTKREFFKNYGNVACQSSVNWIESLPKNYNSKQIWYACKNKNWMLWLLERTIDKNDPRFRLLACAFVRRTPVGNGKFVWDLLTDKRSKRVVEVAELYAVGNATNEELAAAVSAASAAEAAVSAASAAEAAEAAAWAAAWAAEAAAWDSQCDIIREFFNVEEL